jgi:hypothetical protein
MATIVGLLVILLWVALIAVLMDLRVWLKLKIKAERDGTARLAQINAELRAEAEGLRVIGQHQKGELAAAYTKIRELQHHG